MTGIAQSFCRPTIIACTTILCVHLMIWTLVHICLGDWSSIIVVIIVQQSVGKEQCEAGGDTWFNFRSGTTTTPPRHYCGTTRAPPGHYWHKQANATHSHLADIGINWTTYIYCFHQKNCVGKGKFPWCSKRTIPVLKQVGSQGRVRVGAEELRQVFTVADLREACAVGQPVLEDNSELSKFHLLSVERIGEKQRRFVAGFTAIVQQEGANQWFRMSCRWFPFMKRRSLATPRISIVLFRDTFLIIIAARRSLSSWRLMHFLPAMSSSCCWRWPTSSSDFLFKYSLETNTNKNTFCLPCLAQSAAYADNQYALPLTLSLFAPLFKYLKQTNKRAENEL